MLIRKLYKFECAHRVRGCSTRRCSHSVHGHSYRVEIILEAQALDHGQMVYDFGLLKTDVHDLIDGFDHAVVLWSKDAPDYIEAMQRYSERWVVLPMSPSAEQFSRVIFRLVDTVLSLIEMANGEDDVRLHSVVVHETETGCAQCFRQDAANPQMGHLALEEIAFSRAISGQWRDPDLHGRLVRGERRSNFPPQTP